MIFPRSGTNSSTETTFPMCQTEHYDQLCQIKHRDQVMLRWMLWMHHFSCVCHFGTLMSTHVSVMLTSESRLKCIKDVVSDVVVVVKHHK